MQIVNNEQNVNEIILDLAYREKRVQVPFFRSTSNPCDVDRKIFSVVNAS